MAGRYVKQWQLPILIITRTDLIFSHQVRYTAALDKIDDLLRHLYRAHQASRGRQVSAWQAGRHSYHHYYYQAPAARLA